MAEANNSESREQPVPKQGSESSSPGDTRSGDYSRFAGMTWDQVRRRPVFPGNAEEKDTLAMLWSSLTSAEQKRLRREAIFGPARPPTVREPTPPQTRPQERPSTFEMSAHLYYTALSSPNAAERERAAEAYERLTGRKVPDLQVTTSDEIVYLPHGGVTAADKALDPQGQSRYREMAPEWRVHEHPLGETPQQISQEEQ